MHWKRDICRMVLYICHIRQQYIWCDMEQCGSALVIAGKGVYREIIGRMVNLWQMPAIMLIEGHVQL